MIISVSGKINSGKDLIGEIILYLTDKYYHSKVGEEASFENWRASNIHSSGYNISHKAMYEVNNTGHFVIKKFADKLKDIVCILLRCTREQLEDEEFKNTELGEEWDRIIASDGKIYLPDDYPDLEYSKLTPRLLLQLMGTECGRQIIHPSIWVNSLMSDYKDKTVSKGKLLKKPIYPNWIITDCRFPNELKAVKDRGGITIRINRLGLVESNHLSETSLDSATFDFVINNDKDIEHLINEVRKILEKENLI